MANPGPSLNPPLQFYSRWGDLFMKALGSIVLKRIGTKFGSIVL